MTTSENSPQLDFWRTLDVSPTSSSEVLPVRRSAQPTARERALRTITSFGSGAASSSRSDLSGARLRTALAHAFSVSTGSSMRWVRRATPAGHPWWVLTMPARTTAAGDFGWLLPTPSDGREEYATRGKPSLATMVGEMIPTPIASDVKGSLGRTRGDGRTKRYLAQMIPTPRASDQRDQWDNPRPNRKNGLDLPGTIYPMLGTPRASRGYDDPKFSKGAEPNPREFVYRVLPTPLARDAKSDQGGAGIMSRNSRPLSETSGSLGLTGAADSPVSQRRALLLGLVAWMMGVDASWLRMLATLRLPRSATRSSRRSRKRSPGQ
jgi:hypothetical protein